MFGFLKKNKEKEAESEEVLNKENSTEEVLSEENSTEEVLSEENSTEEVLSEENSTEEVIKTIYSNIDTILTSSKEDELRYFFTEIFIRSWLSDISFSKDTYWDYIIELFSKLKKDSNSIILSILSKEDKILFDWHYINFWNIKFNLYNSEYSNKITINIKNNDAINNKDLSKFKDIILNKIIPNISKNTQSIDIENTKRILEIKYDEIFTYSQNKLNISITNLWNVDLNVEFIRFVTEYNIWDYSYKFNKYLSCFIVNDWENEITILFDKQNNLSILHPKWTFFKEDFIQNFLLNFLKYLRNHIWLSEEDYFKKLEWLWVTVFKNNEEKSENIEELYNKYWFIWYDDIKNAIDNNVISVWKNKDFYNSELKEKFPNIKDIVPNAILFEWPPWTWKTTFARIIWDYLDYPFVYIPIWSLMSKWYGESEKKLDEILEYCWKISDKTSGIIIMIDEIDEIWWNRESSHEATWRITWVLLKKLDWIEKLQNILLIGSTNRKNSLDPALRSRFKTEQYFREPNLEEIKAILSYYTGIEELSLDILKKLEWKSWRDIKNMCEHFAKYYIKNNSGESKNIEFHIYMEKMQVLWENK